MSISSCIWDPDIPPVYVVNEGSQDLIYDISCYNDGIVGMLSKEIDMYGYRRSRMTGKRVAAGDTSMSLGHRGVGGCEDSLHVYLSDNPYLTNLDSALAGHAKVKKYSFSLADLETDGWVAEVSL